jgi:hypothetical protein
MDHLDHPYKSMAYTWTSGGPVRGPTWTKDGIRQICQMIREHPASVKGHDKITTMRAWRGGSKEAGALPAHAVVSDDGRRIRLTLCTETAAP